MEWWEAIPRKPEVPVYANRRASMAASSTSTLKLFRARAECRAQVRRSVELERRRLGVVPAMPHTRAPVRPAPPAPLVVPAPPAPLVVPAPPAQLVLPAPPAQLVVPAPLVALAPPAPGTPQGPTNILLPAAFGLVQRDDGRVLVGSVWRRRTRFRLIISPQVFQMEDFRRERRRRQR